MKGFWLRSFVALFCCSLAACSSGIRTEMINTQAPSTRLSLLSGEQVALSSYYGKPVVLVFWASTCPRSPKVMEQIDTMAPALSAHGVKLLSVSLDKNEDEQVVRDFLKYRDADHFTPAFSGNAEYDEAYLNFKGSILPYIVIIDAQGKIVALGHSASTVSDYFHLS